MNRYLLSIVFSLLLLNGAGFSSTGFSLWSSARAQNVVQLSNRPITIRGQRYWIHKVRKGETLAMIAKAYAVSQDEIKKANSLTRETLRNRQTLLIPRVGLERPQAKQETATASAPTAAEATGQPKRQSEEQRQMLQRESATVYSQGSINKDAFRKPTAAAETAKGDTLPRSAETIGTAAANGYYDAGGRLKPIDRKTKLNIAVLLPVQPGLKTNARFSEYYKGMLLGLEALKSEGISAQVQFMNSGAAEEKVQSLIRSGKLDKADLIIGPAYAEAFEPVAEFAAERGIPVVSPLGAVGAEGNPYVFEAAPADGEAYRQIFERFGGEAGSHSAGANFVLIDHVEHPDSATVSLIERQLGDKIATLSFTGSRAQSHAMDVWLNAALSRSQENIVYVPVNRSDALEGVLSHLSSLNITGRYRITVIGTPRWEWISNLNFELFYKLNVHYPASYHADRSDPAVAKFYHDYMNAFGELPTPYSFRGYDVIRYFGGALGRFGSDMPAQISGGKYRPELLQVGYDFRQEEQSRGKYRNMAWPVVHYKPNYSIEVIH
ncbi:MAG: LysM peptidoglycan-binding domain-containing protein [Rikenella sp.]|nr:LysM peptidoglycan-binding domain-containing protein [Rikenella sp.]